MRRPALSASLRLRGIQFTLFFPLLTDLNDERLRQLYGNTSARWHASIDFRVCSADCRTCRSSSRRTDDCRFRAMSENLPKYCADCGSLYSIASGVRLATDPLDLRIAHLGRHR